MSRVFSDGNEQHHSPTLWAFGGELINYYCQEGLVRGLLTKDSAGVNTLVGSPIHLPFSMLPLLNVTLVEIFFHIIPICYLSTQPLD